MALNSGERAPGLKSIPEQGDVKQFARRFLMLKLSLALLFLVIAGRLVQIQILESPNYKELARKQYEQKFLLPAVRGNILDRNGNVLVSNTMFVSFAADPKIVGSDADEVAAQFCRVFGKPRSFYLSKLHEGAGKRFVWLERRVKPEISKQLELSGLDGIVVINEPKRLYHYDDLAGAMIGFTNIDNRGISGIELQYDEELRGKNGSVVMQRDGLGRTRPSADYPRLEPVDGADVVLTIDLAYQSIVEEELKRGVERNKADGGLAVMMNPKSGELLALATVPSVNPNNLGAFDMNAARNRIVTDMFEPGSIFKVVTASAAYENQLVTPAKRFNAENGSMKVPLPGGKFRLIKDTHEYDWLTFQEAMENSSNIVLAKVGEIIGPERFYRQARDFGFGILTGIELPGEARGKLKKPNEWSGTTLQTLAFGYEVAATPLQIITAYAAVANKGKLMRPYAVSKVRNQEGYFVSEEQPVVIRRVVSEETAALLTQAFEGVVERGTAKEVKIEGMRIAGKTGTSRKYVDGKYDLGSYTSSFVAYFPAEDPQIVCLIMMDNPRALGYYGGVTSGPVFRRIAERIINTTGRFTRTPRGQETKPKQEEISVPDIRNLRTVIAQKILEGQGLKSEVFGEGDFVVRQSPEPGKRLDRGDVVRLMLNADDPTGDDGLVQVPDLRGMSMRRAINRLVIEDFDVQVNGSGVVTVQFPSPGQKVNAGSTVQLICEPRPVASAVLY